ncbi:MAG: HlyD family secretion protein, partial [Rudaea sp.]|nr:HlyD family secretion protein [Rudaea sp.]
QAQAATGQASAAREHADAAIEQARVAVDRAQLDLDRTEVRAPVDGYVTNLELRVGDYASAGTARMALVDSHSYYVYGYFEETKLPQLRIGDPVDVRLMAGNVLLPGRVESVARGITDRDNPTGADLLANVNPTFNWVRLAQRVPVRIAVDPEKMPAGTVLSAGMTVTVIVRPAARS